MPACFTYGHIRAHNEWKIRPERGYNKVRDRARRSMCRKHIPKNNDKRLTSRLIGQRR